MIHTQGFLKLVHEAKSRIPEGDTNIHSMAGGWSAWQQSGAPIE